MPFDPQFALGTMLPLAEAAYDVSKLPSDWTLLATIQPDNFGFIARNQFGMLCVSFRGTETKGEWLEDFDGLAFPAKYGNGMVHQGFQDQYEKLRGSILPIADQAKCSIWITGHSLGAALALLCQADLANQGFLPLAYTWAGPRVGWHDFAAWFQSLKLETNRIVNEYDIVPRVPSVVNGYEHVGLQVLIDGGRPPLDSEFLKTAHNLELSYRPGMEKLAQKQREAA